MKFVRCFVYGLEPGQSATTVIAGQSVTASYEAPQFDVPIEAEETTPATSEADAGSPAETADTGSTPTE